MDTKRSGKELEKKELDEKELNKVSGGNDSGQGIPTDKECPLCRNKTVYWIPQGQYYECVRCGAVDL